MSGVDSIRILKRCSDSLRLSSASFRSPGRTRTSDRVVNAILLRSIDRGRCVPSTGHLSDLERAEAQSIRFLDLRLGTASCRRGCFPRAQRRKASIQSAPWVEDSATEDQGSGCAGAIFLSSRSRRSSPHRGTQRTLPRVETGQPIPGPERPLSLFLSVGFDRLRQSCRCPLATTLARGRTGDCA